MYKPTTKVIIKDDPFSSYWGPKYKIPQTGEVKEYLPAQRCYRVAFDNGCELVMSYIFLRRHENRPSK